MPAAPEIADSERLARARTENRELKRQLAVAIIDNDEFRPATLAELEAENQMLRARLDQYIKENERLSRS